MYLFAFSSLHSCLRPNTFTLAPQAVLELKDISKFYALGKVHALKNISLKIFPNEFVAIMGQSGSGKSTMLNILGCLDQPTSGQYFLNGTDVSTLNGDELARIRNKDIGFVFQMFHLLADHDATENVILPLRYAGIDDASSVEKAHKYLSLVGMGERLTHKPAELSGGQQQRVAIARALINQPAIILADEPTGNLDSKTTDEIMQIFKSLHEQGNTVIFITHEPEIASFAQRTIVLKDGEIESDNLNNYE